MKALILASGIGEKISKRKSSQANYIVSEGQRP